MADLEALTSRQREIYEFISEKLCRYLVNDNPPKDLVKKVSRVFQTSEGDLKKVYAAIIFSEEFMQRGNYRSKFRTPVEDPKDVTILFLLKGLGMSAGLGAFAVVGLGTAFLCGMLLVLG